MLKKILFGLAVAIVLFVIVGMLLPRHVFIERSVLINRPASLVFATVNSFQRFPLWSPWQDLDPNMTQATDGPRQGVGAKLTWSGNDDVGSGTQVITSAVEYEAVRTDLDFGDMGVAKAEFLLAPEEGGTRVTWKLDADMGPGPIGRYFGLAMDGMVGPDYERGLANLKTLVEGLPDVDIAGFVVEPVDLAPQALACVTKTTAPDTASIGKGYADAYGQVGAYLTVRKLTPQGPPLGIEGALTDTSYTFDACMPIASAEGLAAAGNVSIRQRAGGRALRTTHTGSYDGLGTTFRKLETYAAAYGYETRGPAFEVWIDDPATTPVEALRTEMFWPVK
jgi:hypothetical protein